MLTQILRGTDWSKLGDYLSPAFFDTVSPIALATKLGALSRSYVTRNGFAAACANTQSILASARLPISLSRGTTEPTAFMAANLTPDHIGQALLELYFRQIFEVDTALLDFRSDRFSTEKNGTTAHLLWDPSPLFVQWEPSFISAIRRMYLSFYTGDWLGFDEALQSLGLTAGRDQLLAHFGSNQTAVTFRLQDFRSTFHQIFVSVKKAKSRLPADFIAFGAGLVCLYEHLEALDVTADISDVFFRSVNGLEIKR